MWSRRSGVLWIAFGAALWGTDTVFRRPLTGSLDPSRIVLYEHVLLSLVVLPVLIRGRAVLAKVSFKTCLTVLAISWIGSALATLLFTMAIGAGNPTTAVLLQKTQPVFAILFARWTMRERWPVQFPWIAATAIAGGYLVAFGGGNLLQPFASVDWRPALLALGAAVGWALCTVWGRIAGKQLPFEMITSLRIFFALPLLVVIAGIQGQSSIPSVHDFPALIWMALVPGFAGLMVYYRGLRNTPAATATIAELAFPLTASLLNWLFLGVHVGWIQVAGFALVWSAILSLTGLTA